MELSRRDALKALGAGGVALGLSEAVVNGIPESGGGELSEADIETMLAVADVVYPSQVEVSAAFVETYLRPLSEARRSNTAAAIADLDRCSRERRGVRFAELDSSKRRDDVLRSLGVDTVYSSPSGPVPARIKFYLVHSLLYALLSTPKGSRLFGIRNPTGYPGGFATYRQQLGGSARDD